MQRVPPQSSALPFAGHLLHIVHASSRLLSRSPSPQKGGQLFDSSNSWGSCPESRALISLAGQNPLSNIRTRSGFKLANNFEDGRVRDAQPFCDRATSKALRPQSGNGIAVPRLRHRTGHGVLRHLKRPAAPKCASRTPCSAAPSPPVRVAGVPHNPKRPVFDFRAHFCHSAPIETHAFDFRLSANAPESEKRFPISNR